MDDGDHDAGTSDELSRPNEEADSERAASDVTGDAVRSREALRDRQSWFEGQRRALDAALNGESLASSLRPLVETTITQMGNGTRAAFYLASDDGTVLHHVVGMPDDYARAIDGFKIGPESLACGLATHTGKAVLTTDVMDEPRWKSWRWMAQQFNYRGCWSFPVHTSIGTFIGTYAVYSERPRTPTSVELELASLMTHTASIIVARHTEATARRHAESALRTSNRQISKLVERLEQLINVPGIGVLTFDTASGILIDANDAFLRMTGYTRSHVRNLGLTWRGMTPDEYIADSERRLVQLEKTGSIGPYEKEYFLADGNRAWMLFAGARTGEGTVVEYCVDITRLKNGS